MDYSNPKNYELIIYNISNRKVWKNEGSMPSSFIDFLTTRSEKQAEFLRLVKKAIEDDMTPDRVLANSMQILDEKDIPELNVKSFQTRYLNILSSDSCTVKNNELDAET